jgi:para-nitrobenzyl esterase
VRKRGATEAGPCSSESDGEWAKGVKNPVFTYFWTHAPPPGPNQQPFQQGAYQGSEINYMFDNLYATDNP